MQHITNDNSQISQTVVLFEETHRTIIDYVDKNIIEQREYIDNLNIDTTNKIEDIQTQFLIYKKDSEILFENFRNVLRNNSIELTKFTQETFTNITSNLQINYENLFQHIDRINETYKKLEDKIEYLQQAFIDNTSLISEALNKSIELFNTPILSKINELEKKIENLENKIEETFKTKKGFFKRIFCK